MPPNASEVISAEQADEVEPEPASRSTELALRLALLDEHEHRGDVPISPIGTLNQKTKRQPKPVSQPPRIGPRIRPAPTTIALMPSALPSSRRGNASVTSAAELAIMNAPPTPWTTRPAISSSGGRGEARRTPTRR